MRRAWLILILLVVLAFGLAAKVQPVLARPEQSGNVFQVFFGEGRRMFANHFAVKADVYLHSGLYPSIFDQAAQEEEREKKEAEALAHEGAAPDHDHEASVHEEDHSHSEEGHVHGPDCDHGHEGETGLGGHECDTTFLGEPRDWFEAIGRNFKVTQHTHLAGGKEREILPWLEMAADLDPQREETFVVTAYWLANEMNKPKEAEQFLRRGLRANPKSYEILFELGRVYQHHLKDPIRARNVWLVALRRWDEVEKGKEDPHRLMRNKILDELAQSYAEGGMYDEAIRYFEEAKLYSASPDALERKIVELRNKRSGTPPNATPTPH